MILVFFFNLNNSTILWNSMRLRGGDGQMQCRMFRAAWLKAVTLLVQFTGQAFSENTFRIWSNAYFMLRKVFWFWAQAWWANSSNSYKADGSSLTSSCSPDMYQVSLSQTTWYRWDLTPWANLLSFALQVWQGRQKCSLRIHKKYKYILSVVFPNDAIVREVLI